MEGAALIKRRRDSKEARPTSLTMSLMSLKRHTHQIRQGKEAFVVRQETIQSQNNDDARERKGELVI